MAAALVVALGIGWWWGAAARWDLARALLAAEFENDLLEARLSLLGARVSLYEADLHAVDRHLAAARGSLSRAERRRAAPDDGRASAPDLDGIRTDILAAQELVSTLGASRRMPPAR